MFIVITDFNGFAQTRRCLEALRASRFQSFTIVVVDHGTTGETQAELAREYPGVIRLTGSSNLWWTGAINLGVRYALDNDAEIIMLLNNDCYVAQETISELIELWAENREALVAPVQRDWQSKAILTIVPQSFFLLGFPSMRGVRRLTPSMYAKRLLPTKLIAGGRGVIIPATVFRSVGLFNEKELPHYWADHDFYLRGVEAKKMLYVAARAFVDIDGTRTTMADDPGQLTLGQWIISLHSIRSHRNIVHVVALFKKHYPVKFLYMVGVSLYIFRYFCVYVLKRSFFLWKNIFF